MDLGPRNLCDQAASGCRGLGLSHLAPQRLRALGSLDIDQALVSISWTRGGRRADDLTSR